MHGKGTLVLRNHGCHESGGVSDGALSGLARVSQLKSGGVLCGMCGNIGKNNRSEAVSVPSEGVFPIPPGGSWV